MLPSHNLLRNSHLTSRYSRNSIYNLNTPHVGLSETIWHSRDSPACITQATSCLLPGARVVCTAQGS